jgi:hypothetical protein
MPLAFPPPSPEQALDLSPAAYETYVVPGAPQTSGPPARRIVQCPRCGDFDVEVRRDGDLFAFICVRRRHEWTWTRGKPWPATVIRPTAAPVHGTGKV